MKLYADATLLAAYYSPEPSSAAAEQVLRCFPRPLVSELSELELLAAVDHKVQAGELAPGDAEQIRGLLHTHLEAGYYARIPLERAHHELAREWLAAPVPPLAPFGALHLAAACLADATLATLDRELAERGRELGLAVLPVEETTGATLHEPAVAYA